MNAEVYVGGRHVGSATVVDVKPIAKPLPKPARVEKWQRWSVGVHEHVIGDKEEHGESWSIGAGAYVGPGILTHIAWVFRGYAKPDKVEVGQRWHQTGFGVRVVLAIECGGMQAKFSDGGALPCRMITDNTMMEYLGMAENADASSQEAESVKRDVAESQQRMLADTNYGRPALDRKAHTVDPKADARRANEEAAKRLIENPPEWAYPTAWRCAVLAMAEMGASALGVKSSGTECYDMLQTYHYRRAILGMTHAEASQRITDDALEIVNAYARGMERPTLLGRPGVKGGISTCDLGGDYE